jgi:hypothetical protein
MDNFVKETILPISQEEKKSLAKTAIFTSIFIFFFEAFASYMIIVLFPEDFGIIKWIGLGFFYLVGGFILYTNVGSFFANEKVVYEGYLTDKRIYTTHSRGKNSSSSTYYYITIGAQEFTVMLNIYSKAHVGDKVALHKIKSNSNVFKIEQLEAAVSEPETLRRESSFKVQNLNSKARMAFFTAEDKSAVRKKLFELLFKRTILMAGVCVVLFFVLFLFIILGLKVVLDQLPVYFGFYVPFAIVIFVYLWVNKKTYFTFLDLNSGEKYIVENQVKDIISNNRPMFSPNGIYTSGVHGEYYYLITLDGGFYGVTKSFSQSVQAGDVIIVHETKKSKMLLSLHEKPV